MAKPTTKQQDAAVSDSPQPSCFVVVGNGVRSGTGVPMQLGQMVPVSRVEAVFGANLETLKREGAVVAGPRGVQHG